MLKLTRLLYFAFIGHIIFIIGACKEPKDNAMAGNVKQPQKETYDWEKIADTAQSALVKQFWSPGGKYFNQDNTGNTGFNYWWQAHALDALCDGYKRTQKEAFVEQMNELHAGIKAKNGHTFSNDFYDDMEWLALACLRAYTLTGDAQYKYTAETLWEEIKTGWSDFMGGGISWRKSQRTYKNTPANAPASILAARLYSLNKKPEDLEWAKKIYDWQKSTLVDPATGLVWDGINREGNGNIDKDWKFTYCQGVFIGAGLELFKITNEDAYMNDATRTATYVIKDSHFSPNGILREEGEGDGGLFKGIFIRYLTQLVLEGDLPSTTRNEYVTFLTWNAETLWSKGTSRPAYLFGTNWTMKPSGKTDSSTQLSGVMLVEALAQLQKANMLH